MESTPRALYAHIIIKLLQGPIYSDEKNLWRDLMAWQSPVWEHFAKFGIELSIHETDGFARIIQPEAEENEENPLPRLMRKQTMTYEATLLCVILREILEEFDVVMEGSKLFLTQKEIKERIELFYKDQTNKSKLWKDLSKPINNLVNIGILKLSREDITNRDNNQYEVKRIIKALVTNDKLEEIKTKLQNHVNTVQQ
ncbi:DUF4194 domain-containing protein [Niastella caeni]|uniref:DUF4194 domain-containing protein n=1 Tax=Niastella caeni TaxID=2569763 RepID=A0A4V4GZJ9_9BACT|nr:DUF4194 domain-containing protein [Niastella caeni]THU32996.1 DUF4194 domain-containing protein [Niastella caeni]